MKINEGDIKKLADLSQIGLTDEEVESLTRDAEEIIGFFDELKKADSDASLLRGFKDIHQEMITSMAVEDEGRSNQATGEEIRQFSAKKDGFMKVPKVF